MGSSNKPRLLRVGGAIWRGLTTKSGKNWEFSTGRSANKHPRILFIRDRRLTTTHP